MKGNRKWAAIGAILLVYGLFGLFSLGLPLKEALAVGGDDGFELAKSMLVERHPELASRMWNDQPWLHTLIHAWLFRHFGEQAIYPRLFSFLSVGVMGCTVGWALGRELGFVGGFFFMMFFLTGVDMPHWALAAMLEMPTQCWALIAALLALAGSPRPWRWVLAGALLACATHLKLTALIVVPALGVALWYQWGWRRVWKPALWIGLGYIPIFLLLVWISPSFDLHQLIGTHVQSTKVIMRGGYSFPVENPPFTRIDWEAFFKHPAVWFGAFLAGIFLVQSRRVPSAWVFVGTLAVTSLILWLGYRPWWNYYVIFLYSPLSMLTGMAIAWFVDVFRGQVKGGRWFFEPKARWLQHPGVALGVGAALISTGIGFGIPAAATAFQEIRLSIRVEELPWLAVAEPYLKQAHWIFTLDRSAAFFLGIPIPPELIVISWKRTWSKQFGIRQEVQALRKYRPELIVLPHDSWLYSKEAKKWIDEKYAYLGESGGFRVWVIRRLCPKPPKQIPLEKILKGLYEQRADASKGEMVSRERRTKRVEEPNEEGRLRNAHSFDHTGA